MLTISSSFQPIDYLYHLKVEIDLPVILNDVDRYFYGYTGLNWTGTNGSSLTISSQKLHIDNSSGVRGAKISGGAINDFVDGRIYIIKMEITSFTGTISLKSYSGNIPITQQSVTGSKLIEIGFKANGHGNGIVVEGTGNFVLDNVEIEQSGNFKLLDFSDLEIGGDDDDQLILNPGSVDISLRYSGDMTVIDLFSLINQFEPEIILYRQDEETLSELYKWQIVRGDCDLDVVNKTIDIVGTDNFKLLQTNIDKSSSPVFFNDEPIAQIASVIIQLLTYNGTSQSIGSSELIVFKTKWRVYNSEDAALEIAELFLSAKPFFHTNVPFETRFDILKSILTNLNATLLHDIDGKYYVSNLEYQGEEVIPIPRTEIISISSDCTEVLPSVNVWFHNGEGGYSNEISGESDLYLPFPNTSFDSEIIGESESETWFSKVLFSNSDGTGRIKTWRTQIGSRVGGWSPTVPANDESSSFYYLSLGLFTSQRAGRERIEIELSGIDWPVYLWLTLDFFPGKFFRMQRKVIDLLRNKTKLYLVEG